MVNHRRIAVSVLFGTLFSCFTIIGFELNNFHVIDFSFGTVLMIVLLAILLSIALYYLVEMKVKLKEEDFKPSKLKIFLLLMAITAVFFLIVYPGNFCYDIARQLEEYKFGAYSTHYPPAYCFLVGMLIDLGTKIFGSINGGVAFYVAVQAIVTNFVISHIIVELAKRLKNKKFYHISILYFVIHPFVFNLMLSTCQDVLFGDIFVLLLLEFVNISENEKYFASKKSFIKIFTLTFLMCILRNNGVFALAPAIIIGLISMRKNRLSLLLFLGAPIILFLIGYNLVFMNSINVARESVFHESLNIPVLQIARAVYMDRDKAWDNNLNKYFTTDCDWQSYGIYPSLSDGIKLYLRDEVVESDLLGFIGTWGSIGLKAPNRYIEAPAISALTMYYPFVDHSKAAPIIYSSYIEYGNGIPNVERKQILPEADNFLRTFFQNKKIWNKIPIFRIIWSAAFSVYLFIIAIIFAIYKKTSKYALPLGLIFGLLLTVFLAPVVIFRYMFPVVLATPVMFYVIIKVINQKRGKI